MADTIVEGHINGALLKQAAEEIQTLIDKYNEVQDKIKLNNSDLPGKLDWGRTDKLQ